MKNKKILACDVCGEEAIRVVKRKKGNFQKIYLCKNHKFSKNGVDVISLN